MQRYSEQYSQREREAGVVGSRPFKNTVARPRHVAVPPSLACKFPKCRKRQRRMNTLSLRPSPPLFGLPASHALHLTLGEFLARGKNLPLSFSLYPAPLLLPRRQMMISTVLRNCRARLLHLPAAQKIARVAGKGSRDDVIVPSKHLT